MNEVSSDIRAVTDTLPVLSSQRSSLEGIALRVAMLEKQVAEQTTKASMRVFLMRLQHIVTTRKILTAAGTLEMAFSMLGKDDVSTQRAEVLRLSKKMGGR